MKAKIQPRIHSTKKSSLLDAVPLATPYSVHIDVCSVCNYKCTFCFQSDKQGMRDKGLKVGKMKMDMFQKIVDDLAEFDDKIKKIKIGNHGEPTLHEQLPEMIAYAKSKNVANMIEIFTNASKLCPDLNRKLVDSGLTKFNISIEGISNEQYMKVAQVKVDIDEMVANIKDLYEHSKDCYIYVKIAADDKFTKADEEKFYSMFGDICHEIFVEKIVPQWPETDANKEVDMQGMYGQKITRYKHVCPFVFMYLHFNNDGTTSPCTLDWSREVIIGNVKENSVKEIWEGQKMKALQKKMLMKERKDIPACDKCMAPMVCVEDDLDDHTEELLEKLF